MGYSESLEAAGAKVISFQEFGSYQGDWAAMVEFNGQIGIVTGSYGSCSGCDAFQSQFDFQKEPFEKNGKYFFGYEWGDDPEHEITKERYDELNASFQKKLADFGMNYLTAPLETVESINTHIEALKADDWFDGERKEMWAWCLSELQKRAGG